jgi:hypothetical protein
MEPSNNQGQDPPANVWAFPNKQPIIDINDASARSGDRGPAQR